MKAPIEASPEAEVIQRVLTQNPRMMPDILVPAEPTGFDALIEVVQHEVMENDSTIFAIPTEETDGIVRLSNFGKNILVSRPDFLVQPRPRTVKRPSRSADDPYRVMIVGIQDDKNVNKLACEVREILLSPETVYSGILPVEICTVRADGDHAIRRDLNMRGELVFGVVAPIAAVACPQVIQRIKQ